ncbi:hypothetical protein HD554DRAFT_2039628 [Boletus coccyginus]|nr:hypothetical protein HD554DRAFT_2039628 [Boletus coccyginus]
MGVEELDFHFSVLQPSIRYCHFKAGILHLKKVMGRTQQDIQRLLIAVMAGLAPQGIVMAITCDQGGGAKRKDDDDHELNLAYQSNNIDIDPHICKYIPQPPQKVFKIELAISLWELENVASDGDNDDDDDTAANTDGDT